MVGGRQWQLGISNAIIYIIKQNPGQTGQSEAFFEMPKLSTPQAENKKSFTGTFVFLALPHPRFSNGSSHVSSSFFLFFSVGNRFTFSSPLTIITNCYSTQVERFNSFNTRSMDKSTKTKTMAHRVPHLRYRFSKFDWNFVTFSCFSIRSKSTAMKTVAHQRSSLTASIFYNSNGISTFSS